MHDYDAVSVPPFSRHRGKSFHCHMDFHSPYCLISTVIACDLGHLKFAGFCFFSFCINVFLPEGGKIFPNWLERRKWENKSCNFKCVRTDVYRTLLILNVIPQVLSTLFSETGSLTEAKTFPVCSHLPPSLHPVSPPTPFSLFHLSNSWCFLSYLLRTCVCIIVICMCINI